MITSSDFTVAYITTEVQIIGLVKCILLSTISAAITQCHLLLGGILSPGAKFTYLFYTRPLLKISYMDKRKVKRLYAA